MSDTSSCLRKNSYLSLEILPQCHCRKGFTGPQCSKPVCGKECGNFGTCQTHSSGQSSCLCFSGYTGPSCNIPRSGAGPIHTRRDESRNVPVRGLVQLTCLAVAGPNPCKQGTQDPCGTNGNCVLDQNGTDYTCSCVAGYTGPTCNVDLCANMNCNGAGHGRCDTTAAAMCVCDGTWSGELCDNNVCENFDCGDHGAWCAAASQSLCL